MTEINNSDIKKILMRIENPGRYSGGEYGSYNNPPAEDKLNIAVSYPDLYEIGMSNNAVKILYNMLNSNKAFSCDRVFAPAPDLEEKLKEYNVPLFTLENRTPLSELDIMAFSFGYELTATNLLCILETGGIPLLNSERGEKDPFVIAGGPGVTNPVPYGRFIDFFYIGEAENSLTAILEGVHRLKGKKASRQEISDYIGGFSCIWYEGKKEKVQRDIWGGFGAESDHASHYPVPSASSVQDHGVVEVMRGCPNGCRFCHAGIYYRPKREKDFRAIAAEVDDLVHKCGYREITLSSLSSGDYTLISDTISSLNRRYSSEGVSFSLPSLKLNSFTLPLLQGLNTVRKSGLTFAVETPDPEWQKSLNKEVNLEQTISVIKEAKAAGWRVAKFYFMIGLPPSEGEDETEMILDFLFRVQDETKMNLNVNIGTFIPKPHTPYQRSAQLYEEDALSRIYKIKNSLKKRNIKLGYHSPFMSYLESIFSRGDERAGDLLLQAYRKGARLDAWDDYNDRKLWREVIESQDWDVETETCREREAGETLPWDSISLGVSRGFFEKEMKKSAEGELTEICDEGCDHNCGVCGREIKVVNMKDEIPDIPAPPVTAEDKYDKNVRYRAVFSFEKTGKQIYFGHLDIMRVFEKSFLRSRFDLNFTEGFNPKPRMEFAHPLSLGVESFGEIASVELKSDMDISVFQERMNKSLPEGLKIVNAVIYKINRGDKIYSLMSLYSGTRYRINSDNNNAVFDKLDNYIKSSMITDYAHAELNETGIVILVKPGNKKGNLFKILKEITGSDYPLSEIDAAVLENFASGKDIEMGSFFDFYRNIG